MDLLVALGISIGVLISAWVYLALSMPDLQLIAWAGIVAWATFYAAGGGGAGLQKAIASNLAGNFWAAVALYLSAMLAPDNVLILAGLFGVPKSHVTLVAGQKAREKSLHVQGTAVQLLAVLKGAIGA